MLSEDAACTSTSLNEIKNFPIHISPNPFSDYINIDHDLGQNLQAKLYDIEGKLVAMESNATKIETSDLNEGFYILQLTDIATGNQKIEKLVLQR